jgi:hypothetical protein
VTVTEVAAWGILRGLCATMPIAAIMVRDRDPVWADERGSAMTTDRSQLIRDNAKRYYDSTQGTDGSTSINMPLSLRSTFGEFHDMTLAELCSVAVALNQMSLFPGQNAVIGTDDHAVFHAWCAQLLLGPVESTHSGADYWAAGGLKPLEICFHAALAQGNAGRYWEVLDPHAFEVLIHSGGLLTFASFAGLEMLLRRSCSNYLAPDGLILQDFRVSGRAQPYVANGKSRCSNVGHELRLFYETVASRTLQVDMDAILQHISLVARSSDDGFDVLFYWRNSTMHGEVQMETVGGAILNLITLILLHNAEPTFDARREEALSLAAANVERAQNGRPMPGHFYPPV